jgi:hypothetical protein
MNGKRGIPVVLLGAALLSGCMELIGEQVIYGSGPVISENRSSVRFTSVSNATEARVEILQGPTERIRVRAQDNILRHVRTEVSGGTLRIYTDQNVLLRPSEPITVELDIRTLERITSSGSGPINAPLVDARRIEVNASGSGDVRLPSLLADSIIVLQSGSGEVTATGSVSRLRVVHSGSGRIETREMQSYHADITMSGSGGATIRVRDMLRATLSGAGSLRYYGSPSLQQTVTGSGRVERAGG